MISKEARFPQLPKELFPTKSSYLWLEKVVLESKGEMMESCNIEDLMFLMGIDYWVGDSNKCPLICLTWRDQ